MAQRQDRGQKRESQSNSANQPFLPNRHPSGRSLRSRFKEVSQTPPSREDDVSGRYFELDLLLDCNGPFSAKHGCYPAVPWTFSYRSRTCINRSSGLGSRLFGDYSLAFEIVDRLLCEEKTCDAIGSRFVTCCSGFGNPALHHPVLVLTQLQDGEFARSES
jgi:hypothetical protein